MDKTRDVILEGCQRSKVKGQGARGKGGWRAADVYFKCQGSLNGH